MPLQAIWERNARNWQHIGPPLRPQAQDVAFFERAVAAIDLGPGAAPRLLLLGVTPEIARMQRPATSILVALDHNAQMVRSIWPARDLPESARAVLADWRAMPIAVGDCNAVLGDGFHTPMGHPDQVLALSAEIQRVLDSRGRLVLRTFVRPAQSEDPEDIFEDLAGGRIGNFHVFKWRLAMALHGGLDDGVRLGEVWEACHRAIPDRRALAGRLGWEEKVIATIDGYRESGARYLFPTLVEMRELLATHFVEVEYELPDYELGDRCPRFVLAPRPR